jgi:hypothetical protein
MSNRCDRTLRRLSFPSLGESFLVLALVLARQFQIV